MGDALTDVARAPLAADVDYHALFHGCAVTYAYGAVRGVAADDRAGPDIAVGAYFHVAYNGGGFADIGGGVYFGDQAVKFVDHNSSSAGRAPARIWFALKAVPAACL